MPVFVKFYISLIAIEKHELKTNQSQRILLRLYFIVAHNQIIAFTYSWNRLNIFDACERREI